MELQENRQKVNREPVSLGLSELFERCVIVPDGEYGGRHEDQDEAHNLIREDAERARAVGASGGVAPRPWVWT